MTPEELEDTIEFSQTMVQELLEIIGDGLAANETLRKEIRALRGVIAAAGLTVAPTGVSAGPAPVVAPNAAEPRLGAGRQQPADDEPRVLRRFDVNPASAPPVAQTETNRPLKFPMHGSERQPTPLPLPPVADSLRRQTLLGEIYEVTPLLENAEDRIVFGQAANDETIPEGMEYVPLWMDHAPHYDLPESIRPVKPADGPLTPPSPPPAELDLLSLHLPPPEAVEHGLGAGVLLVEDSRVLQSRLRAIIEALGYTVIGVADTGPAGVQLARSLVPRVAILDHGIAGATPQSLLAELRALQPALRLMVCTPELSPLVRKDLVAWGCSEVLAKPIQLDHFVRALRRCMDDAPLA
jgi:two-component system chemotaxis response regulator CheY